MLEQLKNGIFHSKWTFLRLLQLVLASMVLVQAITDKHYLLIIPAVIILYMALSNSCHACRVPGASAKNSDSSNEIPGNIEFIEIKEKK